MTSERLVSTRNFGRVRAAVISVGSFQMGPRKYRGPGQEYPATVVDARGRVPAGLCSLFVDTGSSRVLVDVASFPPAEATMLPELKLTPGIEDGLASLGVDPETIDYVVLTHGHFDHCSGVVAGDGADELRFSKATHLIHAEDWDEDGGLPPDWHAQARRFLQPVYDAGRLELVHETEHVVCDGISMIHCPGETPGHAIVRIDLDGGRLYHLGDLIHLPGESQQIDWAAGLHDRNEDQMVASRRCMLDEVAETQSLALFSHAEFPAWGGFEQVGAEAWRWHYADAPVDTTRRRN